MLRSFNLAASLCQPSRRWGRLPLLLRPVVLCGGRSGGAMVLSFLNFTVRWPWCKPPWQLRLLGFTTPGIPLFPTFPSSLLSL
uniref:Uncharacterized protein n=1 Tax=Arundo donax TaxID=35708 RepID=A0A0A9HEZ8_ARUDO